jgi:hypothetical protein
MKKQRIISLGLVVALSTATISAFADTSIYTDGIGRLHFLGKDASSNGNNANYANPAQQDLTRKLYGEAANGVVNDTSYDQHPLKNYENTFPDSRFTSSTIWKTKYSNGSDANVVEKVKATTNVTKGQTDYSGQYAYGSTFLDNPNASKNEIKTVKKKHWWNKK